MCVDMGGWFTLSGKLGSQRGSRKWGFTGGFTKSGVHRGVHKKGGSREPCEPPPLATGLPVPSFAQFSIAQTH